MPRIARGRARMAVGAGLAGGAALRPQRLGGLGQEHGGVVRGIQVVAEADGLASRERIALGVPLRRDLALQGLEVRDEIDDLGRREHTGRAPGRHHGRRERGAWIVDLLVEIPIGEAAGADRREVGADVARGPDIIAGHQVAARAGASRAIEEQRAAAARIAGGAGRHRGARHRRRRARVGICVGGELAVIAPRPPRVAHLLAPAVGEDVDVAPRLGDGA
jgi:hypothetical protein